MDDVRNGLSLCQTHHWAFDLGLRSATNDLDVMVQKGQKARGDEFGALRRFKDQKLVEPVRPTAIPHRRALA